jgi:FHA domain
MPTCPAGHDSESTDFCDVCGMRMDSPAQASVPVPAVSPPDGQGPPCPRCGADRPGQFCEACGYSFASGPPAPGAAAAPAQAAPGQAAMGQVAPGQAAPGQVAADQADPDRSAAAPGRVATAPSYVATAPSQAVAGPSQSAAATPEWTAVVTADRAYFDSVVAASGPDAAAVQFPAYCPERRLRLFGPEMRIGRRSPSRGLDPEIDLTGPPADPGVSHLHAVLISDEYGGWTVFDPGSANGTLVNGRGMAAGSRLRLRDGDRICVGAWTMLTIRAE